jgi:glycosyltransferase involved in cell wall biosynthesis
MLEGHAGSRVAILPAWYPSPEAPEKGIAARDQAECLARTCEVHVLVPCLLRLRDLWHGRWPAGLRREIDNGVEVWRQRRLVRPALPRLLPGLAKPSPVLRHIRDFCAAVSRGAQRLIAAGRRPDVLHAHAVLPAGLVAARLGKRYGIPVVLTEYSAPFMAHMRTKRQRALVKEALEGADRVLAVTPALAGLMQELWPTIPIGVLGHVVRTDIFTPGRVSGAGANVVFFLVAELVAASGVKFAVLAVQALLRRNLACFELVIAGEGPERPALEALVRDLGLTQHCRFLGARDRAARREQLQRCDVFVLPSFAEPFGVVLGEAMACGKPVIATRCGGPEFVVTEETGILVSGENVEELAGAMARFVLRQCSFDAAAVRASVVRRFGEEAFVNSLTQIYETLGQGCGRAVA